MKTTCTSLHQGGTCLRRHLPILVNIQDPDLHRLAASTPATEKEAWTKASSMRIVAENRRISSHLRSSGVHVVDVPAERLIYSAVGTYLDLKRYGL